MSVIKAKGIVLKEIPSGESGKTLIFLAEGMGKIMVSVKGAKNVKSKFNAASELFTCGEYCFYEGKGFYSVTQAEIIEKFYEIRTDVEKFAYACYFSDMIISSVFEGMESDDILRLFLRTLTVLSKTDIPVKLAARVFELRLLKLLGFSSDGIEEGFYFSKGTEEAISYIMKADENKMFSFRVSEDVLRELGVYTKNRILFYIGEDFKSLGFAENL